MFLHCLSIDGAIIDCATVLNPSDAVVFAGDNQLHVHIIYIVFCYLGITIIPIIYTCTVPTPSVMSVPQQHYIINFITYTHKLPHTCLYKVSGSENLECMWQHLPMINIPHVQKNYNLKRV